MYRDSIFDSKGGEGLLKVGSFKELPELNIALKMTGDGYDIGEVDGLFEFEGADVCDGFAQSYRHRSTKSLVMIPPAVSSSYLRSSRISSEFRLPELENFFTLIVFEVTEKVGCIIGCHFF